MEGSDVPENMEYDLANMEIIMKQSKWAQQVWRTWKSEKGHRDDKDLQSQMAHPRFASRKQLRHNATENISDNLVLPCGEH